MSKLALGTAQFGLNYGVANTLGKVAPNEVQKILDLARKNGVYTIDTAASYGDSESVLGSIGLSDFQVVTKLSRLPTFELKIDEFVRKQLEGSLERLGLSSIYGLLLHNPEDLFNKGGKALLATLIELKSLGIIHKIGVSVYDPQELRRVMKIMPLDLVQLPLNLLDRRFERDGLLKVLHDQGVEIHCRSVFLQGFLLMSYENMPAKFHRWHKLLKDWESVKQKSSVRVSSLCLSYPLSLPEVDRVVVGVDNLGHLEELIRAEHEQLLDIDLSFLESHDPNLLNPSKWNIV